MSWLKEFENEDDWLDALYTAHLDGECQDFLKSGECTFCTLEMERRQWEEKAEHRARINRLAMENLEALAELFKK